MQHSDPFVVRAAVAADRAFALELVPRLRAFGPPPLRPAEAMDAAERRALERAFDAPPAGSVLLVAESRDGTPLGLAYAESSVDYFTGESHGHLSILAVAEQSAGKGVGRALLAAVDAWAAERGFRFVTLNVFAGNDRARAVYERAGYTPDMVRLVKEVG